jgi:hypothetical protein
VLTKARQMVLPQMTRDGPIEAWIIDDTGISPRPAMSSSKSSPDLDLRERRPLPLPVQFVRWGMPARRVAWRYLGGVRPARLRRRSALVFDWLIGRAAQLAWEIPDCSARARPLKIGGQQPLILSLHRAIALARHF